MFKALTYLLVIVIFKLGAICKRWLKLGLFLTVSFAIGYIACQTYPELRAFFSLMHQLDVDEQKLANYDTKLGALQKQLDEANVKLGASQRVIADAASKAEESKKNDIKLVVQIADLQDKLDACGRKAPKSLAPTGVIQKWAGFCVDGHDVSGKVDITNVPPEHRASLIRAKAFGECWANRHGGISTYWLVDEGK